MRQFFLYIILICVLLFQSCKRVDYYDEYTGIKVLFYPEKGMFPFDWYIGEVDAQARALPLNEIERSKVAVSSALQKYPVDVITDNLDKIYILRQINFYGVDYAGTYSDDKLFMANSGVDKGYTLSFLEQSFHHEFSSILYWNYSEYFDKDAWLGANENGDSIYFDELGGAGAMISGQDSDYFDEYYHEMGFLYEYATSSFENDLNSFAENLFKPESEFWEVVDKYERLRKKVEILIDFYNEIDSVFTEEYFRNLSDDQIVYGNE